MSKKDRIDVRCHSDDKERFKKTAKKKLRTLSNHILYLLEMDSQGKLKILD